MSGHGWHPRLMLDREAMRAEQARVLAEAIIDTGRSVEEQRAATPAGDVSRLRGIPAVGRGVGGAIRGTRPTDALGRLR